MPKVRFTDVVDKLFGGVYSTTAFEARNGDEITLSEAEAKRISRDFPGLIKVIDAKARPGDDESPEV